MKTLTQELINEYEVSRPYSQYNHSENLGDTHPAQVEQGDAVYSVNHYAGYNTPAGWGLYSSPKAVTLAPGAEWAWIRPMQSNPDQDTEYQLNADGLFRVVYRPAVYRSKEPNYTLEPVS